MADHYEIEERNNSNGKNYRYIDRFHPEYPPKLQDIPDPPAGLYVKGKLPDPNKPAVAIVGSRICSQYGRLAAEEFGRELSRNGVQIISGMARGIDGIAQQAAYEAGGQTFGVLGCGINVIYPAQNRSLYEKVEQTGGLITEFAPDAPPMARQFPSRNRIISGLCDILLVIEAKEKSGTSITVGRALEQGKDIFALPGRIHDICSAGCNRMIAQGAGIALSAETILEALGLICEDAGNKTGENGSETLLLEKLEKVVYSCVDFYPISLDRLSLATKLPIPELLNVVFHLQMKGVIREEGIRNYVRIR